MRVGPGARLGHYVVVGELSRGGMGVVYRARDERLDREVALKVLPPELVRDPDRRQRFVQEARAASALEHPNIAVIHEIDEVGGVHFIAMELIRGDKLADVLAAGPLPPERALDLAIEMAEGLARAHEKGVVHRDLKPANVMVTDQGHAKIIDFGLAKLVAPLSGDAAETTIADGTDPGVVLGTVSHMSPEQARGQQVDHRTDVFSFGIVLHEMLTGQPPFRGASSVDTLHGILHAAPLPLPVVGERATPEAVAEVQRIRDKCLAKAADDRYQGLRDAIVDLRGVRRRIESGAIAAPGTHPEPRRTWRRWAAAAVVIAVAAAGTALWRWSAAAPPAASTGKPALAVLYFDNHTGNPSLDWLRTGLADMLVTDLSQSPDVEILGTSRLHQILREMNRADEPTLSFDVVQELARRANVETVVLGSYLKAGDTFRIDVKMHDVADGRILSAERVEAAGEANLFPTMDELTQRLKVRLQPLIAGSQVGGLFTRPGSGGPSAGDDRSLHEVTTDSIEAYRYYIEGSNLHDRLRSAEAIPLFQQAVALDPGFALAMAKLAAAHANSGHIDDARKYSRLAYEHRDRAPERERHYIAGGHFLTREETLGQAIDAYERGLAFDPGHGAIRHNLAFVYTALEREQEAMAQWQELVRRGTTYAPAHFHLALSHTARGEYDRAKAILRAYADRHPQVPLAPAYVGYVHLAAGELAEAQAAFDRIDPRDPSADELLPGRWAVRVLAAQWSEAAALAEQQTGAADPVRRAVGYSQLAFVRLYRGRSADALTALERAIAGFDRPDQQRAPAQLQSAELLLAAGRAPAAALRQAQQAYTDSNEGWHLWRALHAIALAQEAVGQRAAVQRTLDDLVRRAQQLPSERELRRVRLLNGQIALQRGDVPAAIAELSAARAGVPRHATMPLPFFASSGMVASQIRFALGQAHLAANDLSAAAGAFRELVDSGVARVENPLEYVRSLYLLATIHDRQGNIEGARDYYRRFLDHWGDGDLDRDEAAAAERWLSVHSPQ